MRLIISLGILLLFSNLNAAIYSESTYSKNYFYDTEFEEIIRFDPLEFKDDTLSSESQDYLKKIVQKIETYKHAKKEIFVSIIGHTSLTTDNVNEKKIASRSYAKKIQNYFFHSFDSNESLKQSKSYALEIQNYLENRGIDKNITMVESRLGKDKLFSTETQEGNTLSNRVMLTLYVQRDLDTDRDGVLAAEDNCPNSKIGAKVDENGCSYKTIVLLLKNQKSINEIIVKTDAGSSFIKKTHDYALVKSQRSAAKVLSEMSEEEMKKLFGNVLIDAKMKLYKFTLYFDDTKLLKSSESTLSNIINLISSTQDTYIQVIGHTDTKGKSLSNDILAKKRAESIKAKIKAVTNSYMHLETSSYGEHNLAVQTADEVREPLNKRVEILIR